MDICNLDNQDYRIEIVLLRRNVKVQELPLDHVLRMSIVNDCYEPFPRLKLVVKDPGGSVIPLYAADNNSVIAVTVQSIERYGDTEKPLVKKHAFNINRVKPTNFGGSANTYEIDAVSKHMDPWMNSIQFSTAGNNVSVTEAAGNILAKAGIPFVRPVKEASYRTFYVADVNSPVRDHVQRLLDFASIGGDGFYFTFYDRVNNELKIESTKNILKNVVLEPYNIFAIPSDDYGAEEYYVPISVHHTNDVSATRIDTISRGMREYNFDFDTGAFFEQRMEYIDIKNGSTSKKLNPVIDNTTNIEEDINYTQKATGHNWYGDIRNAVRTYNGMLVTVKGTMQRDIGDIALFRSSDSLQNTFGGFWMNARTVDTFDFGAGKYTQNIVMSRVGKF